MSRLAEQTWTDLVDGPDLLVVPLGATEQHGPHLPLETDTEIAEALAGFLGQHIPDVVVAPAIAYGSSGEHQGFAGTISIGQDVIRALLVELGRSANATFPRLLFISAHGGNAVPVADAVRLLRAEGRDVYAWSPAVSWSGDAHAGYTETSIMLALNPAAVRIERAVPGETRPLGEIMPALRTGGVAALTDAGVLGDPTGATADHGLALLESAGDELCRAVAAWPDHDKVWL